MDRGLFLIAMMLILGMMLKRRSYGRKSNDDYTRTKIIAIVLLCLSCIAVLVTLQCFLYHLFI
jgi:hypothetical protein